jgi:hypothetical protein
MNMTPEEFVEKVKTRGQAIIDSQGEIVDEESVAIEIMGLSTALASTLKALDLSLDDGIGFLRMAYKKVDNVPDESE